MLKKSVEVDQIDSAAVIRINRPDNFNALDVDVLKEMTDLVAGAAVDDNTAALIITGTGNSFCAGGDLSFIRDYNGSKREALGILTKYLHRLILDLRQLPKPVIAAVNGTAAGAGMSLCMACDLRIAADSAKFKQAYTSVGLVPDGGWNVLVGQQLGSARASELLLLDPVFDADTALRYSLVNRVVIPDELMSTAFEFARKAGGRQASFARSKTLLNVALAGNLENMLEAERQAIMTAGESEAFQTALENFFAK
jgi:2-(1,2-epoxy-1,2-dihydrophenyl)acetyl-CoA isomerase